MAPGSEVAPANVSVLAPTTSGGSVQGLGIDGAQLSMRQTAQNAQAALLVLVLAAVGSIFVGLVAVAGFSVIAQRRLRGVGLLGALGATPGTSALRCSRTGRSWASPVPWRARRSAPWRGSSRYPASNGG